MALVTNGRLGKMKWPPARLATATRLGKLRLKDGNPHDVRIVYEPPLLSVHLDDDASPLFRAPLDLRQIVDADGAAYIGFTAATGAGFQNHDILSWTYSLRPDISSTITSVRSEIQFERGDCLPDRNLCTPREPVVEALGASGGFSILLPAHAVWTGAIQTKALELTETRGVVCFDLRGDGAL